MKKEIKDKLKVKSDDELVHTWKVVLGRLKKAKGSEKEELEAIKKYIEKLRKPAKKDVKVLDGD